MEYTHITERYVPNKEEFTMLLEGASIQSLCEQATYTVHATCVVCNRTMEFIDANFPGTEADPCINCTNKENNTMGITNIDLTDSHATHVFLMSLTKKEVIEIADGFDIQVHKSYRKEELSLELAWALRERAPFWCIKGQHWVHISQKDNDCYCKGCVPMSVLVDEAIDQSEAEVADIKDRLQKVVDLFGRSTMPSQYRKMAGTARAHKNTRFYGNTREDWVRRGWAIIEHARSMNRAYARGDR